MNPVLFSLIIGLLGLAYVAYTTQQVLGRDQGNADMQRIGKAIQEGATAFLYAEYRVLAIFVAVVAVILALALNWQTALSFIVGALLSALAGNIGMNIAVRSNLRTAAAAQQSLNDGLRVAFGSGSVMGMSVVSLSLIGISALVLLFEGTGVSLEQALQYVTGFGFGASSIALFARVGGGIYTKAADVGADLVGKVEQGIPEDDPRNPAVIADNVGDNVGDVAGMGADLFESYSGSIIAAGALSFAAIAAGELTAATVTLPFLVAAVGIIAAVLGTFLVRAEEGASQEDLLGVLRRAIYGASVLVLVGVAILVLTNPAIGWDLFTVVVIGLVAGNLIGYSTEHFTSYTEKPTQGIAKAAETGPATLLIEGLAVGMVSTAAPAIIVMVAVIGAFYFGGLYGVALAAVGMLSTLGITLATDAYGPVADNAGGIAEMAHLPSGVRDRTDALDSLGNTTAATGKGFAIGSAVLTALALMAAYAQAAGIETLNLLNPIMLGGLLLGAMLPYLFAALTMTAVGKSAMAMVEEARRQFREIPGLMEGENDPDYRTCVEISTQAALREMVLPGVLAVVVPVAVGFILGAEALAGLLIGATASGFMLAVMMANAGGAWDNAKKWIETGVMGGKGSANHKAAVVGDTVGDPFKDTSGPALNILIKLMSIVALVFAPLFGAGLLGF
ncbi:MAG: sodium-translocating pyrophosphatase [Ardenticatenales bacterium]|nr:sodium-translocating pyrophosphatase [Ardenticatenales bacterium]MCB9172175.1 sodium-translocating pyrophosphatase [Ardenticatenales bacterium]